MHLAALLGISQQKSEVEEVCIHLQMHLVGHKFKGIKMLPPGVHLVAYNSVSAQGDFSPTTSFFVHLQPRQVAARPCIVLSSKSHSWGKTISAFSGRHTMHLQPCQTISSLHCPVQQVSLLEKISMVAAAAILCTCSPAKLQGHCP